jgi:catalase
MTKATAKSTTPKTSLTLQYRNKTILALGASQVLLGKAGIEATLPSGAADPGVLRAGSTGVPATAAAFIKALARHRHPERESDPPRT